MAVDAASSRSGAAVPVGPMDASEGGIRVADNYVAGGIEPKTSALIPIWRDSASQFDHKTQVIGKGVEPS
jgi:hypothetical protein